MTDYVLEAAWVDGQLVDDLAVTVEGGRFATVGGEPSATAIPFRGLALPGFANCHSHVFHRALRGHTQRDQGTFWTWRDQMYAVAERLDPDSLFALARATYMEMLCAGFTSVGEFHYLHHGPNGVKYADPNETGKVLIAAARDVGLRITLLDTCYVSAGIGKEAVGVQRRFSDGDADQWADRVSGLGTKEGVVIGAAIHSVRAVPREQMPTVVAAASGRPLHVHHSEQIAENEECLAAHGITPARLLDDVGALGPLSTAVHATHLTDEDIKMLGTRGVQACFCPTTERDLADGVGPSHRLREAGVGLTIGSDSQAVIDPFEEMRAIELNERLATQARGHWTAAELLRAGTVNGHTSLGFPDAGMIAVGQRADLVVIDPASVRTAGTGGGAETAVFAATGGDVTAVMVDGQLHEVPGLRETCGRDLLDAIEAVWR